MITNRFPFDLKESYAIAIHVLISIQNSQKPLNSTYLCKKYEVSKLYLRNILARLKTAGFIDSVQGIDGGYILSCQPERTSAMKIYKAVVGELIVKTCLFKTIKCDHCHACPFYSLSQEVNGKLENMLKTTYLNNFLLPKEPKKRGRKPKEII